MTCGCASCRRRRSSDTSRSAKLAGYLGRSPDTVTVEDLRRYQLYLVDHGTSPVSLNAAITGLKFFFEITLETRTDRRMRPVRVPHNLPVIQPRGGGPTDCGDRNLKHQTALSLAYGAGLRASEVISLKVGDIDSQRMTLRVEQGKGSKDRYAMLSPVLLERLRVWWRVARAQGKMLDGGWLFPGQDPVDPLTPGNSIARFRLRPSPPNRQTRIDAYAAPQFRHAPARTEGGYPCDSGAARPQEA